MCMREVAGKPQEHILYINLQVNLPTKGFTTSTITALKFYTCTFCTQFKLIIADYRTIPK